MNSDMQQLLSNIKSNVGKKDSGLIELGLIIEKNTIQNPNNNDYTLLLSPIYQEIKLSEKDINEILDFLLQLIEESDSNINNIIWALGKSYKDDYLNKLFHIVLERYPDNIDGLKQLMFSIDTTDKALIEENLHLILEVKNRITDNSLIDIIDKMIESYYLLKGIRDSEI